MDVKTIRDGLYQKGFYPVWRCSVGFDFDEAWADHEGDAIILRVRRTVNHSLVMTYQLECTTPPRAEEYMTEAYGPVYIYQGKTEIDGKTVEVWQDDKKFVLISYDGDGLKESAITQKK